MGLSSSSSSGMRGLNSSQGRVSSKEEGRGLGLICAFELESRSTATVVVVEVVVDLDGVKRWVCASWYGWRSTSACVCVVGSDSELRSARRDEAESEVA